MSGAKLKVKVHRAVGHGPHGLFPSEQAYCLVEVPGATPPARQTEVGIRDKSALLWEEEMQFELGSDTKEIKVVLYGQLPHIDDPIGSGTCNITGIFSSPRDASEQDVKVPLEGHGGRQAGELELTLAYQT